MTDFYSEKVVSIRKPRRCDGCRKLINKSEKALVYSGKFQGDFGSFTLHVECREAEIAYNKLQDARDDWYPISEIEGDDWDWLLESFPIVADRKGITQDRIDRHNERVKAFWGK